VTPALLYGANGYTGRLIARLAAGRNVQLILAGRSRKPIARLAGELGLAYRVFALDDDDVVAAGLDGVAAVLHCAGPFIGTYEPMARACIARGVHYLDITGEIDVFEALAARDAQAREAGVMLLPGVGFDVVPTDCLAVYLDRALPDATRLLLGFTGAARSISRGTARTMVQNMDRPSRIRHDGRITEIPAGSLLREVDFGRGPRTSVAISWGDVASAWYSTGIPNIEVYRPASPALLRAMRLAGRARWLVGSRPVRALARGLIRLRPEGPSDEQLATGSSVVWGRVEDDAGNGVEARVHVPDGYALTADAALHILGRVLRGEVEAGFQTPAMMYGPDLILALAGTRRVEQHATIPVPRPGRRSS
jgi:short subunit dehydrogenase-like uncharacterized protein